MDDLISLLDLAQNIGCHPNTLRMAIRRGEFVPTATIGNKYYFSYEDGAAIERVLRLPRRGRAFRPLPSPGQGNGGAQ